jgi:flagellar biosynthesis protein FliR
MDILKYIPNFLFILIRAGIMVSMFPFFSSSNFPSKIKIGLAVAIALILAPVVEFNVARSEIPLIILREIIFGIALGLSARIVFFAVDMAGQLMSTATGLSMASILNPEIGQSTEISMIYGIIAMFVFLSMDAHHELITIFVKSYEWLPAGSQNVESLVGPVVSLGSKMFIIALKVSAPIVILMLIANILLGFIYKAAPQINIFFVAYPIYVILGFTMMILSVPIFIFTVGDYFSVIKDDMLRAIAAAKG